MVWIKWRISAKSLRRCFEDGEPVPPEHPTEASREIHLFWRISWVQRCKDGCDDGDVVARPRNLLCAPRTTCRRGNPSGELRRSGDHVLRPWQLTLNAASVSGQLHSIGSIFSEQRSLNRTGLSLNVLNMSETASQARERKSKSYRGCTPCK